MLEEPYKEILIFLLGALSGHRLALWRDRRKDFNAIAAPIRETLLHERASLSPIAEGLSATQADALGSALPRWQRRRFAKHWQAYADAKQQLKTQDAVGQPHFTDPETIKKHIDTILAYTRMK